MGVNISGKGSFAGTGSIYSGMMSNLLATLLYTYTTTGTPGTQGNSYYTTYVGSKGPGYVANSYSGLMAYSSDGLSWSMGKNFDRNNTKGGPDGKIAYGNGTWVIQSGGDIYYSTDGINWNKSDAPNGQVYNTYFVHDRFFGNSNSQGTPQLYTSVDGVSWTATNIDYSSLGTSYDSLIGGVTHISDPAAPYRYIAFMSGNFNLPGGSTFIYTPIGSVDGSTWTLTGSANFENSAPTSLSGYQYGTKDTKTLFSSQANVYITLAPKGFVFYSSDLATWSYATTLTPDDNWNMARIFVDSNGMFVFFGQDGNAKKSYNGSTWETHGRSMSWSPGNTYLPPVKLGNDYWVFGINSGFGYESLVYYSDNGMWNQVSAPPFTALLSSSISGAISFNGRITVYNFNGEFIYSPDGTNWTTGGDFDPNSLGTWYPTVSGGEISTLQEVQTTIGGQGSEGSYVETLSPVVLYQPSTVKNVNYFTVTNSGANVEHFDLFEIQPFGSDTFLFTGTVNPGETKTFDTDGSDSDNFDSSVTFGPGYGAGWKVQATAANVLTFRVYEL
jgi:hypothetical protein